MNDNFFAGLKWWLVFMKQFNGKTKILDDKPITNIQCDACTEGGGAYFSGDYMYINWNIDMPDIYPLHIDCKEIIIMVLAIFKWSITLQNKRVLMYTDNMTAKSTINKMSSKNSIVMTYLRLLFFVQAYYNFSITAIFIPGKRNILADSISRLHQENKLSKVYELLPLSLQCLSDSFCIFDLLFHMSYKFVHCRWWSRSKHPRKGCG